MEKATKNRHILTKISVFIAALALMLISSSFASAEESALGITQTSAVLGLKQSITVVSFSAGSLKVTSNSKAVRASVYGGNQVTLYGNRIGNAVVRVCNDDLGCQSINVKVQKNKDLSFKLSKSKITIKTEQTYYVTTYNGKNVTALTNSGAVNVYVDGARVYITGEYAGSATVTVCSTNRGCLPIFVKVLESPIAKTVPVNGSDNIVESKILKLSQVSATLLNKETIDITAESSRPLTAISNTDAVRTAVNGNRITLYASYIGEATVGICDEGGSCGSVYVRVLDPKTGNFQVSQSKVDLKTGESIWIGTKYGLNITASGNSWSASAKVKGNLVLITASTYPGTAIIYVCSKNNGCVPVRVNVENPPKKKLSPGTFGSYTIYTSKTLKVTLPYLNQTAYYLINNSDANVVSAQIIDTGLSLQGIAVGTATISVCPTTPTLKCGTVAVTVNENPEINKVPIQVSETNIALGLHQTTILTSSIAKGLAAFSDSDVVQVGTADNKVTLYGQYVGDAVVAVCAGNGTCANVKVRVSP